MSSNWKSLEDHVRGIAALRWASECRPEHINGVDFDGVVRVSLGEVILIEITTERTLSKVRDDINKIMPTRIRLATEGVICRGFVVLEDEPTLSMVEAGQTAHISVMSAKSFERDFFDFSAYDSLRSKMPFGSAVDSKTGENDPRVFVPVSYKESGKSEVFSVEDIVNRLLRGGRITLTGDFGTGKSRCTREVYSALREKIREAGAFPVAINLRDHWSASNAVEVLAGHLGNIGLTSSIDNIIRLLNSGALILILDGFDEIGAQSYDTRVDDRKALRRHAVRGVRDLVEKSKAGILVTGRSHFFDSDEEMLQSLGLNDHRKAATVLGVPDEFSTIEAQKYLRALGIEVGVPTWLPRKPLVFQILVELDHADVSSLLSKPHGNYAFWAIFIEAVCARESRGVSNSISPSTIKIILMDLAGKSRYSKEFLGRLSPRDIDDSYEYAVGSAPDQTGRQLLSRMCTLGRIEPESPDRQFVDPNVVDVLRGEHLINGVVKMADEDTQRQWKQSLRIMGTVFAATMVGVFDLEQICFSYLKKYATIGNTKKLGEIISVLTFSGDHKLDFQNLHIRHSEMPVIGLGHRVIANLMISSSIIHFIDLQNSVNNSSHGLHIEDSLFSVVAGVSSKSGLPDWIANCEVMTYEVVSNSARIKESDLGAPQKLLLAIIHKIFFQPGAGREEASLLKGGYGQRYSPKLVESILKLMIQEGLVERFKGQDGWVYKPVRRHTERMSRIKAELTLSEDCLWKAVGDLRE